MEQQLAGIQDEVAAVGTVQRTWLDQVKVGDQCPHLSQVLNAPDEVGQSVATGAELAEGIWLVCPVQLTNNGELNMLGSKVFKVTDELGREFPQAVLGPHFIQIWATERWMNNDNQLLQNPIDTGVSREGPFIFDVAEDSTGLRLTANGIEESIDLGF